MAETVLEREPEKYLDNKMQINITVRIVQPNENVTTYTNNNSGEFKLKVIL